ncbi:hypothetical protein EDB92DRAFT_1805783 [Lactarius akahatsu]|uniref:Protein kinase domain-containing protein n=1 Tax=Lactarius akahatsu TaxID=416441 RepID=A0AAD4L7P5_9AGAM|nr:hypothetical protein EDB92DRAFT_1805783 [Lactarius akahatsu]
MVQTDKARIASFFLELKREIGEGGCDPTTQVSLSMRRTWIHNSSDYIRQRCCCPTFLIGAGGPWWSVLGSVFTDKFIVQRLTTMEWMVLSSTDEYNRIYRNAKIFVALRNCLSKLQIFYNTLGDVSPLVANQPHPRYFPYPSSFTAEDGSVTRFQYLKSLEEDAACVTYLAETRPDEHGSVPEKVVVKFVSRYGKEVHEFLAGETYAPSLRYYGPLSGTGFSGVFPGPAQSAPPNPHSPSPMYMVVMDYIEARPNTPRDISAQIRTILTRLHSEGYVFGDLRKQNILFDADGKVKLIDFNWCGRYDMKIADENLPEDVQDHIDQNKRRVQAGGPYAYAQYPVSMSTLKGMWAPGMVPLGSIRPIHDWMMFKRLPWQG